MARVHPIQTNFTAGEFSPQLEGRTDITKYFNAARTLENFIIKPYGGAARRPGTYFVAEVKDSTKRTRIYPFQFSVEQAYIIEIGDLYMRFYKDNGQIESAPSVPYEIVTPYLEADIFDLQFAQSADTLYIVHKDYSPAKLTRTGHTAWTLTAIDYTAVVARPAQLPDNVTDITITPSADTGSGITLTASSSIFDTLHIGSIWKIKSGYVEITGYTSGTVVTGDVLYGISLATGPGATKDWSEGAWSDYQGYPSCVTFYEQRLCFAATIRAPQSIWGSQSQSYENMERGADDDTGLLYTIATDQVNAIQWTSSGKVLTMGTAGGTFTLSSGSAADPLTPSNVVVKRDTTYGSAKLLPKRIGNFVYYIQRNNITAREVSYDYLTDSFTSLDMTLLSEHITGAGIVDMDYQQSLQSVLWSVRGDGQIACMTRQVDQQVIAWNRMITAGLFESIAIIPNGEEDQIWVVVNRTISGTTKRYVEYFMPEKFADQEHCFFVDSGLTLDNPKTISGATQANPVVITCNSHGFNNGDIIKIRDIVGMTELNGKKFTVANKTANDFELSGINGIGYSAYISGGTARKAVNILSGLDHLEGKELAILADGAVHPNETVSGGLITLDDKYSIIHAGLPYISTVQTMRVEAGTPIGTIQALIKTIIKATVRIYQSLGFKIGNSSRKDLVVFRIAGDYSDSYTPLFTGDKEVAFPAGWEKDGFVIIVQEEPLPLTILAIITLVEISEE